MTNSKKQSNKKTDEANENELTTAMYVNGIPKTLLAEFKAKCILEKSSIHIEVKRFLEDFTKDFTYKG